MQWDLNLANCPKCPSKAETQYIWSATGIWCNIIQQWTQTFQNFGWCGCTERKARSSLIWKSNRIGSSYSWQFRCADFIGKRCSISNARRRDWFACCWGKVSCSKCYISSPFISSLLYMIGDCLFERNISTSVNSTTMKWRFGTVLEQYTRAHEMTLEGALTKQVLIKYIQYIHTILHRQAYIRFSPASWVCWGVPQGNHHHKIDNVPWSWN